MDARSISSSYKDKFNPKVYLQQYLGDSSGLPNDIKCELDVLNEIFSGGMLSGKRLLDVGTGPSFYTVIAASRHFDDIYLSDFTPQNIAVLNKWWSGTISHMDHLIKYCLDLEKSSQAVQERNSAIRKKVKSILSIDVQKRNPLSPNEMLAFDAIVSGFCLECASGSRDDYKIAASNVKTLLKTNGKLILLGALDIKTYNVGDVTFEMAAISEKDILEIYKELGFKVDLFKVFIRGEKPDGCDEFAMVATKMID